MQVFEEHKDRATRRGPAEKFHNRIEKDPSRLFRREFKRRRNVGKKAAELRHQTSHLPRVIPECGSEGVEACRLSHCGLENFDERAERERILGIGTTAAQPHESSSRSLGRELGGNSGLADAEHASDHDDSALAAKCTLELSTKCGTF